MKFKYWALSLLACGGMLSCTNEDVVDSTGKGETSTSYLAVNILNTSAPGTRAYPGSGDYEDGNEDESEIKSLRFYLFDASGNPYTLSSGTNCVAPSYTEDTDADKTSETVEQVGKAVLVIEGSTDTPPASMVAVINYAPDTEVDDALAGKTLSELKAYTADYSSTTDGFVMTNSVYNDASSFGETSVVGKVEDSSEDAELNPVEVYVERVLAKVTVSDGRESPTTAGTFLVSGTEGDLDAVYAVINGWQVADYNTKSYILKNINKTWTDDGLGITPWSSLDYHRSFWATSVPFGADNVAGNYSWENISTALGSAVYTQENTPTAALTSENPATDNTLTKVIVAATLMKKGNDGILKEAPKYTLYGADYASENDVLTEIAGKYANTYFTRTGDGSTTSYTYKSISKDDLEFKTPKDLNDESIESYYVVAQLKSGVTVYEKSGNDYVDATTGCNTDLKTVRAKVWNGGKTYYFTTIQHLGGDGDVAEYGVVRNHSYKVNIENIQGFGTPVYDPTETIIPVIPTDQQSYIAARINVLSWRVVNKDVTLGGE